MISPDFWRGKKVLVTGHTGFKGSWLSFWLHQMGADVAGYSLAPPTEPALFTEARLDQIPDHHNDFVICFGCKGYAVNEYF
ncbi:hypothetical protein [Nitrospirillum iridis]|uniref:Nucleoside-diphosphate-sugar epimerase n=1 Tax=Nitrospirillum iridis TaxID=765888 RepID=A0A7X0EFM8_9PROT|nr:hypothetical protein [Nitrospirillum iridis]MBB6255192.1 nucleoside-diphosphate-sugar epimerase [Nitrospirillum iridis]